MITRCEYCRQMSDGLECRKCGAPLRLESRYSVGSQPVHVTTQAEDVGLDYGGFDYMRRNSINNMIVSIAPYKFWTQRGLVNWRSGE